MGETLPPLRVLQASGSPNAIPVYTIQFSGATVQRISATGVRILIDSGAGASGVALSNFVVGEIPTPTPDGVITAFATTAAYATGTLAVYRDGLRMTRGASADYTETTPGTGSFTLVVAADSDERLIVDYIKS